MKKKDKYNQRVIDMGSLHSISLSLQ